MKKNLFGALIVLFALTACTDNDTEDINPSETTHSLTQTITYYPTQENFETRNIKYYDNNIVVADSTYANSGNFISRNIHTIDSEGNYTIETKNAADVTTASVLLQYDSQGRLTDYDNNGIVHKYVYSENTITVKKWDDFLNDYIEVGMFMINADGYIASQTILDGDIIADATSLTFSNNKPVSLMAQGVTGAMDELGTFSYYTTIMPSNLQKTIIQINNEVLIANTLKAAALFGNYHLQDIVIGNSSYYHSDTVFISESGYEGYPESQTITMEGQPYCYIRYYFSN